MSDEAVLSRRDVIARAALVAVAVVLPSRLARVAHAQAQGATPPVAEPGALDSSNLFAMDQTASRPVRRPPKPGARASMTASDRDELEHHLRCQCGCTLDVYTCRTTDFSCRVSPSMHRDVMSLVDGGYVAPEIIDAFVSVYGEKVLMAPTTQGFNLFGWLAPFIALGGGAIGLVALLRSWRRSPATATPAIPTPPAGRPLDATDEELARLRAVLRDDA